MPRKTRFHVDEMPSDPTLAPKHLTKQEFGRRLYRLMISKGWNQSELARQAQLPRDSVSVYVRGRSLPTPKSLAKLAEALEVNSTDLLPNAIEGAIDEDNPSIDMRVSPGAPNVAWLRINRMVSTSTAVKVIEMVNNDRIAQDADGN